MTEGKYNAREATISSVTANMFLVYPAFFWITNSTIFEVSAISPAHLVSYLGGVMFGMFEGFGRGRLGGDESDLGKQDINLIHKPSGSLVGKLCSLPLEAGLGVYDGFRK